MPEMVVAGDDHFLVFPGVAVARRLILVVSELILEGEPLSGGCSAIRCV